MKIKEGFMLRQFGDDCVVVAVGEGAEDFNKLITLNAVGTFVYKQLETDCTEDKVVAAMLNEYEVEEQVARRDAKAFISDLRAAGLLDE